MRKLLHEGVTVSDVNTLEDVGISTLECDYYTEATKRHFEYYAVCRNDADIIAVDRLNTEISKRAIKSHLLNE